MQKLKYMCMSGKFRKMHKTGFPQGLENREKNNDQGKVTEFYFGSKVREKSGNFFILGQKSGFFFPEWLNAAISIKYYKYIANL